MRLMNSGYDRRMGELKRKAEAAENGKSRSGEAGEEGERVRDSVADIVRGETAPDSFYGNLLDHVTVFPDRRAVVVLKITPCSGTELPGIPADINGGGST